MGLSCTERLESWNLPVIVLAFGCLYETLRRKGYVMAENKTRPTEKSVQEFLDAVPDEKKRRDSYRILALMQQVTGQEPQMWGDSIVGFGSYHYKYASGREGDAPLAGFSPRKEALTVYLMAGFNQQYEGLMARLGKYKTSKVCLYVKKLEDIDLGTLEELVRRSVEQVKIANS
jgi:hypothetical protein